MTAHETIHLFGALADMKDVDYKNALAITALIDLLIAKGLITREELAIRAQQLNAASD